MQSLTDLNALSTSASIEFTDERTPDVIFDRTTATAQTITVGDGSSHIIPVGIEIEEIINYVSNATTYTIDVSAIANVTVTWTTIPSGCTVTNPSTGVYKIAGINSTSIWNTVKNAQINTNLYTGGPGTFTYTATIAYKNNTATKTWSVATTIIQVVSNMNNVSRSYAINSENLIFSANTPQIVDPEDTTYTITLSSTIGEFSRFSDGSDVASTWTYTASRATINSTFANIRFYPTAGVTSTSPFTYTQVKNGTTQASKTNNLVGSGTLLATSYKTFNTPGTTTWTPEFLFRKYPVDVLLIGGGGSGGGGPMGGGGGGGGVVPLLNRTLTNISHSITVGAGGARTAAATTDGVKWTHFNGNAGASTQFSGGAFNSTAYGGAGGLLTFDYASTTADTGGNGGAAGNPQGWAGGVGVTYSVNGSYNAGGGGGGPGGEGEASNLVYDQPSGAPGRAYEPGRGGLGYLWTDNQAYGGGGGGAGYDWLWNGSAYEAYPKQSFTRPTTGASGASTIGRGGKAGWGGSTPPASPTSYAEPGYAGGIIIKVKI